jgi:exodeoxyribonuclease X
MRAIILDTETTSKKVDREVIELAWIVLLHSADDPDEIPRPLQVVSEFCQRYRPMKPMTFGSLAVHHILPSELEHRDSAGNFLLPDAQYLIGHSIDFDWEAVGKPDMRRICTLAMARSIWPQADSHTQSALLYLLNGATPETRQMLRDAHSAAADAANNLVLLRYILAAKPEITTWSALYAFSEVARIPTVMPMGRNKGAAITTLEIGEIGWYLERDFIDPYLRKAFEQEIDRRRQLVPAGDDDTEEYF